MDYRIQIQLLNDLIKGDPVDLCNQLFIPRLSRIQRQQYIFLIYIRKRRKSFVSCYSFFQKQFLVCTVATHHRCLRQQLAKLLTALSVLLNQLYFRPRSLEHSRQIIGNRASAHNHKTLDLICHNSNLAEKCIGIVYPARHGHKISGLQNTVSIRNNQLVSAFHSTNQNISQHFC